MAKQKTPRLTFFYLNDRLHKVLHINRPLDLVEAWCYPDREKVTFAWSHIRKHHGRAWTTVEVSGLIGRTVPVIRKILLSGAVLHPQSVYALDGKYRTQYCRMFWSDKDITELHDYLLTVHNGNKRKDGGITPYYKTPSRAVLRARMRADAIDYYVKNKDGELVRAWREEEW